MPFPEIPFATGLQKESEKEQSSSAMSRPCAYPVGLFYIQQAEFIMLTMRKTSWITRCPRTSLSWWRPEPMQNSLGEVSKEHGWEHGVGAINRCENEGTQSGPANKAQATVHGEVRQSTHQVIILNAVAHVVVHENKLITAIEFSVFVHVWYMEVTYSQSYTLIIITIIILMTPSWCFAVWVKSLSLKKTNLITRFCQESQ